MPSRGQRPGQAGPGGIVATRCPGPAPALGSAVVHLKARQGKARDSMCSALLRCVAGDPSGTGKGGRSIYNTPNGKFPDEIIDTLKHTKRGVLSMANSGPNTNGSQFFITYKPHPSLNGRHSVFGHVIDGLEVLDRMERVPVGERDRPLADIKINKVTIHANPLAS